MTIEEIQEVAERFGDTYNREGNGKQMAWAFKSGADWAKTRLISDACEALYTIQDILNADLMDIEKAKDIMRKAIKEEL